MNTNNSPSPTLIYVACIGLTIVTCVLSVFAYLQNVDHQLVSRQAQLDRETLQKSKMELAEKTGQIERLKSALDYRFSDVGFFEEGYSNSQTVLSSIYHDLDSLKLNLPKMTVRAALQDLVMQKKNLRERHTNLQGQTEKLHKTLSQLEQRWTKLVAVERESHKKTQKELVSVVEGREEMVEGKDKQLEELNGLLIALRQQLNQVEEQQRNVAETARKKEVSSKQVIKRLEKQIAELSGKLLPDEPPDGKLVRVALGTKTAWINRGTKDRLQPGTIFLAHSPRAINASPVHAKCRLRVTRILGPSLAELQVLDLKPGNPVVKGDVATSVLWSPGLVEKIAIAGIVDLDGDGRSDLDSLRRWIESAGAKVIVYTGDDGTHQGKQIDGTTHMLVSATVPGYSSLKNEKEQKRLEKIRQHVALMHKAAEKNGVQILSLNRFLKRIGYRPPNSR